MRLECRLFLIVGDGVEQADVVAQISEGSALIVIDGSALMKVVVGKIPLCPAKPLTGCEFAETMAAWDMAVGNPVVDMFGFLENPITALLDLFDNNDTDFNFDVIGAHPTIPFGPVEVRMFPPSAEEVT